MAERRHVPDQKHRHAPSVPDVTNATVTTQSCATRMACLGNVPDVPNVHAVTNVVDAHWSMAGALLGAGTCHNAGVLRCFTYIGVG